MIKGNARTRLDKDVAAKLCKIVEETGWSESNAINVMVRAGIIATTEDPKQPSRGVTLNAIRQMVQGARAIGSFGVIGAYLQPQAHVQMVMNMIDFGLNPQAALDAPRWEWTKGNQISLERGTSQTIFDSLAALGHKVSWSTNPLAFGRGQIVLRNEQGVYTAGTEPRSDSAVSAW